jgi:hypothetical protein
MKKFQISFINVPRELRNLIVETTAKVLRHNGWLVDDGVISIVVDDADTVMVFDGDGKEPYRVLWADGSYSDDYPILDAIADWSKITSIKPIRVIKYMLSDGYTAEIQQNGDVKIGTYLTISFDKLCGLYNLAAVTRAG